MKNHPDNVLPRRHTRALMVVTAALALAGCALPDKPTRPALFDFGPGTLTPQPTNRMAPLPALALAEIDANGLLDSTAVLYRLGYDDPHQLRPYALARWSMSPGQLIRQRLRETLGQRRAILNADEGASQTRRDGSIPYVLRIELEEFSQHFQSPTQSAGVVRLRATLVDSTPAGEQLLGQRTVLVQRPAPSADAPGGVRALAAATDAAVEEISQWLQQTQPASTTPATAVTPR
jgi:cholesterol transport system auxiliary component